MSAGGGYMTTHIDRRALMTGLAGAALGLPLSARAQRRYTAEVGKMCHVFLRLIRMFYDNRAFEVFMTPRPHAGMEWAVHNLVAGNTSSPWLLRLRIWAFYGVCALQRRFTSGPKPSSRLLRNIAESVLASSARRP